MSTVSPAARDPNTTDLRSLRAQIEVRAIPALAEVVRSLLTVADDSLFEFMQKSGANADQAHYIDSIRELRRRQADVERLFTEQLRSVWARFDRREIVTGEDEMGVVESGGLSLVSEDEIESQIAARMLAQAVQKLCAPVLTQIMQRLSWVGGRIDLEHESSPLGALHIAVALRAGLGVCEMPGDIRLIVFKLFERELPRLLAPVLEDINRQMANDGILPHLRQLPPTVPRAPVAQVSAPQAQPAPAPAPPPQPAADFSANERALFATLHELLRGWRQSTGSTPARIDSGMQPMSSEQMLSILTLLQGGIPEGVRAAIVDPSQSVVQKIKGELLNHARQLGLDPEQTCLSPVDEDAIDLVGMLFDVLLDERQLKMSSRELIGRLVVPFIKVALLDRRMFLRKEHPARRLLNSVAEACEGNEGETPAERALLAKVEEVVSRLSVEFNENLSIFQTLEDEFRSFMDQHRKRVELAERRVAEAQRGKERLDAARARANAELEHRLRDAELPPALDVVMRRYWTHHLVVVQLREGDQSEPVRSALACGDALVAMAQAARSSEQALAAVLPQLGAGLTPVLASSGCVGDAAEALVDAVGDELRALAAGKVQARAMPVEMITDHADDDEDAPKSVDAPNLRLVSDRSNLAFAPEDAEALRALAVGSWVEFVDADGVAQPAKLSWISPISSRLLFVNRRGMRVCVASIEELAVMMRERRLSIRNINSAFERAMHQVLGQLRATHGAQAASA